MVWVWVQPRPLFTDAERRKMEDDADKFRIALENGKRELFRECLLGKLQPMAKDNRDYARKIAALDPMEVLAPRRH